MKKIKFILAGLMFFSLTSLTSCLKSGLDDLESYSSADITNIYFEYRYEDSSDLWTDGSSIVKYVTLTFDSKTINSTSNSVAVSLSVPDENGTFTANERAKVDLTNLICSTNLSTAAKIEPVGDSPSLGEPGDFSSSREYLVTAADGTTTKTWTITISALNKP